MADIQTKLQHIICDFIDKKIPPKKHELGYAELNITPTQYKLANLLNKNKIKFLSGFEDGLGQHIYLQKKKILYREQKYLDKIKKIPAPSFLTDTLSDEFQKKQLLKVYHRLDIEKFIYNEKTSDSIANIFQKLGLLGLQKNYIQPEIEALLIKHPLNERIISELIYVGFYFSSALIEQTYVPHLNGNLGQGVTEMTKRFAHEISEKNKIRFLNVSLEHKLPKTHKTITTIKI